MKTKNRQHPRPNLDYLLLVSGSGRNCGKTSLACKIIKNVSKKVELIALKISPHFHKLSDKQELLFGNKKIKIYREKDMNSTKDSSRMLRAGASGSFYLQCEDEDLLAAWEYLSRFLPENRALICESGAMAKLFKPGLHLLVEGKNPDRMKRSYLKNKELSDKTVHFNGMRFNINIDDILFTGKQWILKENQNDQIRRSA